MDHKSLTSLMLRLAGVFILVSAVTSAPQIFFGLLYRRGGAESVDTWALAAAGFALFAIPFLVGLLLIYFPATIANRMVSSADAGTADALLLQQVASSALGLYFVTVAAYETFYSVSPTSFAGCEPRRPFPTWSRRQYRMDRGSSGQVTNTDRWDHIGRVEREWNPSRAVPCKRPQTFNLVPVYSAEGGLSTAFETIPHQRN